MKETLKNPAAGFPQKKSHVTFVAGSAPSDYGKTSPEPNPSWFQVAQQLAKRLPNFVQVDGVEGDDDRSTSRLVTRAIDLRNENAVVHPDTDVLVVLGVVSPAEQTVLENILAYSTNLKAMLCDPSCDGKTFNQRFAGTYHASSSSLVSVYTKLAPWTTLASHQRLLEKTDTLLARKSSEDYLFSILFVLHSLVIPIDVVKSDMYVDLRCQEPKQRRRDLASPINMSHFPPLSAIRVGRKGQFGIFKNSRP